MPHPSPDDPVPKLGQQRVEFARSRPNSALVGPDLANAGAMSVEFVSMLADSGSKLIAIGKSLTRARPLWGDFDRLGRCGPNLGEFGRIWSGLGRVRSGVEQELAEVGPVST